MFQRLLKPSQQSFFLFGPRGTGKTTWIKSTFPQALFLDLLESEHYRSFSARPERLREWVKAAPKASTVVVDEVQRVPQLLGEVHALIEERKGTRFILTGSSSRKLKRSGIDLLAGRAVRQTLHPLMAVEMGSSFRLEAALQRGLIPLVVSASDPDQVLRSYAALYVREEVQMEGLVRNIGNFSRFLEAAAFSHGSVLNMSEIARECEIERKVVEGHLKILEDLLLAVRIPVFSRRAKRATLVHPKFYYFDTGLFRSLRPSGPLDRAEEADGVALEGLVMQHLMAWSAYRGERERLYYWRTPSGVEVDFVLYGDGVFWAVEVQNSGKVRHKDLSSLRTFRQDYPQSRAFLLYRGRERMLRDGILCLPCEEFLKKLDPRLPNPEF